MSELNEAIDFIENIEKSPIVESVSLEEKQNQIETTQIDKTREIFDIQEFGNELYKTSEFRNKERAERPHQNITGYDIAVNCIMQVLFKLRNTPIENYADSWLPIYMRSEVGTAVHNFIQKNTSQFTETELNLKVPSIGFYGKIDFMVGDSTLGEIKTCTYSDYKTIVSKQKPRTKDFLQAFCYNYIINHYLDEIKSDDVVIRHNMGEKPKLDKYNIDKIQFIYIAHDIISSHAESYAEMLECVKTVKKNLNSKRNPFFFITSLVVNLNDPIIKEYNEYISGKFNDIHHYLNTNTNPTKDARYLCKNGCFFCPYKKICHLAT